MKINHTALHTTILPQGFEDLVWLSNFLRFKKISLSTYWREKQIAHDCRVNRTLTLTVQKTTLKKPYLLVCEGRYASGARGKTCIKNLSEICIEKCDDSEFKSCKKIAFSYVLGLSEDRVVFCSVYGTKHFLIKEKALNLKSISSIDLKKILKDLTSTFAPLVFFTYSSLYKMFNLNELFKEYSVLDTDVRLCWQKLEWLKIQSEWSRLYTLKQKAYLENTFAGIKEALENNNLKTIYILETISEAQFEKLRNLNCMDKLRLIDLPGNLKLFFNNSYVGERYF